MRRKIRTSIAIDQELHDWVQEMIKRKRFASASHAVEYALTHLKEEKFEDIQFGMLIEEKEQVALKAKRNT
jgi:Arc/MetJ-type ribon-helix-helix transcriptional regulator